MVSVQGPQLPVRRKGLNYFLLVVRDYGLTIIYECNNECLGERKSSIVGCYSVGLEAFF